VNKDIPMPVVKIPNKRGTYFDEHDRSHHPHPQAKELAKIISKKPKSKAKVKPKSKTVYL